MKRFIFIILLSLFLAGGGILEARAVTVSPAKIEITADPGAVIQERMSVFNETDRPSCFYPGIEKFTESEGTRTFLPEKSLLVDWVKLPDSVCLEPKERKNVPLILELPQDAPPGGHFAVFWWQDKGPGDGSGVGISVKAGILVYVRVAGEIIEQGVLTGYKPLKRFLTGLPAEFSWTFENFGNVHLKPKGSIIVRNIFGRTNMVIPVNRHGFFILPEGRRTFTETWAEGGFFTFGPYRATLELAWGEELPQELKKSRWIFVLPWKHSIVFLLIIVVFGFLIPRAIRMYNEKIIAKARKSGKL